jgi:hypothetical protein
MRRHLDAAASSAGASIQEAPGAHAAPAYLASGANEAIA